MDWETLYCPHRHCCGYGKPFSQGYLVKNGTSRGQPRAWCTACEASVVLSYGTAYYGLEADPVVFETAVRALAEGNALRATARIVQVDKDTVCTWLHRVACHCRTVMLYFWHDLHVSACQLDELWSFVHTKEAHLPGAKLYCDTHVTDDSIPLFTSDQLPAYRHALLNTYGEWYHPLRQERRGAYPKPQRRPPPSLQYAQVVKRRKGGRIVEVSTRVVFGTPEAVAARLAHSPVSWTVNTSFVERDNLTQRQRNRHLTRRTNGFSKDLTWFEKQLWLSLAYYHFVLPHKSLRERLPTPEPTRGAGSPRMWRPVTPAMAAGLTDHVWTTDELLAYRVPVEFLDQLRTIEHLFPEWNGVHHSN